MERTNALRAERGIASLTTNDKLMQAAQVRADEMAANSVYSHTRPDGREYTTVTDCNMSAKTFIALQMCKQSGTPELPCGQEVVKGSSNTPAESARW